MVRPYIELVKQSLPNVDSQYFHIPIAPTEQEIMRERVALCGVLVGSGCRQQSFHRTARPGYASKRRAKAPLLL